jgi:hypothetical protein
VPCGSAAAGGALVCSQLQEQAVDGSEYCEAAGGWVLLAASGCCLHTAGRRNLAGGVKQPGGTAACRKGQYGHVFPQGQRLLGLSKPCTLAVLEARTFLIVLLHHAAAGLAVTDERPCFDGSISSAAADAICSASDAERQQQRRRQHGSRRAAGGSWGTWLAAALGGGVLAAAGLAAYRVAGQQGAGGSALLACSAATARGAAASAAAASAVAGGGDGLLSTEERRQVLLQAARMREAAAKAAASRAAGDVKPKEG